MKTTFLSLIPVLALTSICSAATVVDTYTTTSTNLFVTAATSPNTSDTMIRTITATGTYSTVTATFTITGSNDLTTSDNGIGVNSGTGDAVHLDGSESLTLSASYSVTANTGYTLISDTLDTDFGNITIRNNDGSAVSFDIDGTSYSTTAAANAWAGRYSFNDGITDSSLLIDNVVGDGILIDDLSFSLVGGDVTLETVTVPEPTSASLLGLGALSLLARRKR